MKGTPSKYPFVKDLLSMKGILKAAMKQKQTKN